jgi:hypothetical protein
LPICVKIAALQRILVRIAQLHMFLEICARDLDAIKIIVNSPEQRFERFLLFTKLSQ